MPGLEDKKDKLEKELTKLLIPKDPQDDKNAVLEIRAGTGGDEASLFAGDLLNMYLRYCAHKGWKTAIVTESEGTVGGYKEVVVEVQGDDVYGTLNLKVACTGYSVFLIQKHRVGFILRRQQWQ